MTIAEMHVWFRQYAQQMGMQNVRAILPEQIDLLINTSITDTINQIVRENVTTVNDRVITDNSKLGQINALKGLYNVKYISLSPDYNYVDEVRLFNFSAADRNTGKMTTYFEKLDNKLQMPKFLYLCDFSINYKKLSGKSGYTGTNDITAGNILVAIWNPSYVVRNALNTTEWEDTDIAEIVSLEDDEIMLRKPITLTCYDPTIKDFRDVTFVNYEPQGLGDIKGPVLLDRNGDMLVVHTRAKETDDDYERFVIVNSDGEGVDHNSYKTPIRRVSDNAKITSYRTPNFNPYDVETNYFPVRLIDDIYLADTINDFVLKNRLRTPIITTYNRGDKTVFDLYIDKFNEVVDNNGLVKYCLQNNLLPYTLRMSYIAKPAEVRYAEDIGGTNIDCDLPEFLHVDILKHAVDLYRIAITGSLHAQQQQDQAQQQENVRNNYRNDGNQQQQ